ncbi:MAG: hypothetical protein O2917_03580 [Acidobacteria bacterium]|nr:hypothetical protein [Acidobacteriota bacterium]
MRTRVFICAVLVWTISVIPALAQTGAPIGGRVFVSVEGQSMTAKDTFDAIAGESTMFGVGGGVEVHRLWRQVFLRASVSRLQMEGERVFVFDGTVFRLGIPLDVQLTPIELTAGWRFDREGRRVVPYLGGGMVLMNFREDSPGDTASERVRKQYTGSVAFVGVDVSAWQFLSVGAEVGFRMVKVTRPGGALGAFREDDLGGATMRVMVSVGR